MLSVEEHIRRLLESVPALDPFTIGLVDARGCVLAEDVRAQWPLPAFASAALDGYAIHGSAIAQAAPDHPVNLSVVDRIVPGMKPGRPLVPGTAIRVLAGAALPDGTEIVVNDAEVHVTGSSVVFNKSFPFSLNIRPVGEDVNAGEIGAEAGSVLDARLLGLLAAAGRGNIKAQPKARVVVLSVGSELVEPGQQLEPGKVVDSNGVMLAAAVAEAGAVAYRVGPISDDVDQVEQVISDQLVRADLVIVAGSNSAKSYEAIRDACQRLGSLEFHRIAMHPASAQGFGLLTEDRFPIVTVPSNPAAAFVSFEVFIKPLLRHLTGQPEAATVTERMRVTNSFDSLVGKRHYVRGVVELDGAGRRTVRALEGQATHLVGGLARTDCFIVVPEPILRVEAGDDVDVLLLGSRA